MEEPSWEVLSLNTFRMVISVGVQSAIGHHVVLQKSFEILLAIFAEEKAIDLWAESLERKV